MIEQEINRILNECHLKTRELITLHADKLDKLARELLEKESLDLLDIVRILGARPFPPNEAIKDYMHEIEIRKKSEKEVKKLEEDEEKENKDKNDGDDSFDKDTGLREGDKKAHEEKGRKEPFPHPGKTEKKIKEAEKVMDHKEEQKDKHSI